MMKTMRGIWLGVATVVACSGPARPPVKPTTPPALTSWLVASSEDLTFVVADATGVCWVDDGISCRDHHGGPIARLFASSSGVSYLGLGTADVFFVDGSNVLRALARDRGGPSDLTTFEGSVWGLAGDGDGVWVGVDDHLERWSRDVDHRTVPLPAPGVQLAVDGGTAFVIADAQLYTIDLATGKARSLSSADEWATATALAVTPERVLAVYDGGVIAVNRKTGASSTLADTAVSAIAADRRGWVALTTMAVTTHDDVGAAHIVATSSAARTLAQMPTLALGGGFVYHVDYDSTLSRAVLRGEPRDGGATLLPLPPATSLTAMAIDRSTGSVYAAIENDGDHVAELGAVTKVLADVPAFVDHLVAGDGAIAAYADALIYVIDRDKRAAVMRTDQAPGPPLALHKGRIYWSYDGEISTIGVTSGAPFQVGNARSIDGVADDVQLPTIAFAEDHLYFTIPYAGLQGLGRVDEHGHAELVWTYDAEDHTLDPSFAIIDEKAYLHDGASIYAVPIDGGDATTVFTSDDTQVIAVWTTRSRLVAWMRDGYGDFVATIDHGKVNELWRILDGGTPVIAVGDDAVAVYEPGLGGVVSIPVQNDQPSASP